MPEREAWSALPLVMVRMPVLPYDLPDHEGDPVIRLWSNAVVAEAVWVANPRFATRLDLYASGAWQPDPEAHRRMLRTLLKYANRMSHRPTPFGLFAATGFTTWGADQDELRPRAFTKRVRLDATVACRLADSTAATVEVNPSRRVTARRILFAPPGNDVTMRSVRRLPIVDAICDYCAEPRDIDSVVELVHRTDPGILDPRALVGRLREGGLLVSSARRPAPHELDHRIPMLRRLERCPLGEGIEAVKKTTELFDWRGARTCLAVDLAMSVDGRAPDALKHALLAAMPILLRLAMAREPDPWIADFAERFERRFGHEEVPFERVLDEERPPAPGVADSPRLTALRAALIRRAAANRVSIVPEDVATLPVLSRAAVSYDVFVQRTRTGDPRDPGWVLGPRGLACPGGRAFSRFAGLDPRVAEQVAAAVRPEGSEALFLAIDYWQDALRNLATGCSPYEGLLAWSSAPSTAERPVSRPADLVVGISDGVPYLRSRTDGRKVVARTHHLVNTGDAPPLLDFAHRVSAFGTAVPGWDWGALPATNSALPRVEIGDLIISPARWRIGETPGGPPMPRYVHVGEGDTRLLLDLENPLHLDLLADERRRGREWVEESFVSGMAGRPVEFVATVVDTEHPPIPAEVSQVTEPVMRLPGDRWWAFHVVADPDDEDEVIRVLGNHLERRKARWFFVRYDDPVRQLRIRIRSEDANVVEMSQVLRVLAGRDLVTGFSIEPYRPEIRRYGGAAGLAACERSFCEDSRSALACLRPLRRAQEDRALLAAALTHLYLGSLRAPADVVTEVLTRMSAGPPARKVSRRRAHEARKELMNVLAEGQAPWLTHIRGLYETRTADDLSDLVGDIGIVRSLTHMHLNRRGIMPADEQLGARWLLETQSRRPGF
ncbi:thiopeptide-type bacteriocin biosynthesis protein [Nonomuraea sp. NPDC005650]|uniref:thiopeptide-type bacteriocin biosynthesis protein n=1 Tax=Nonomuraea sp. NPDC005650 TaxID=3157045 RepID=UPI0033B4027B